jgi:hypothetical protein
MLFALFPFSDVHISVDPLVGAVAMMLAFFQFSDVHISVDVLEAALAFGVEGAEEQAQEHRYKRDPIEEKHMTQQKVTRAAFVIIVRQTKTLQFSFLNDTHSSDSSDHEQT